MPFTSKSQMRLCYSQRRKGWDCDKWLAETPSVCNLPERSSGAKSKTRGVKKGELVKGPIKTGSRGGRYFEILEKRNGKVTCITKVYLKR